MGCFNFKKKSKSQQEQKKSPSNTPPKSPNKSNGSQSKSKSDQLMNSNSPVPKSPVRKMPDLYEERAHKLRVFELSELRNATNGFNRALKIGEGGFGTVYKGFIRSDNGKAQRIEVAIKRLNQRSLQGHKQWLAEVQFLGVVEHRNLVKLIGYCAEDGEGDKQRLLVYEFMANRSLEEHLFSRVYPPLSWDLRLNIMLGAAQGLLYLHQGLELQIIFRDFKASNILLDKEFQPKLSDFGLAREGPTDSKTHVSTAVVGTHGYAAPDYIQTGHLSAKTDVWSFGVVLYEILTGRRSLERNRPRSEQKLLNWVQQFPPDSTNFNVMMDPRLKNQYPLQAARELARLADTCLVTNPKERPDMSHVVDVLKHVIKIR